MRVRRVFEKTWGIETVVVEPEVAGETSVERFANRSLATVAIHDFFFFF